MKEEKWLQLYTEFGIHFENAPDELKFLEEFIDECLEAEKQELITKIEKDLEKELQDFRKDCERLKQENSPIQILDTSKNFFIAKIRPYLKQLTN